MFIILIIVHFFTSLQRSTDSFSPSYPNHVWMYYDGELVPVLQKLLNRTESILRHRWSFHYLTPDSLLLYIPYESFPTTYNQYASQAQSDWIRLKLLSQFGGWWIDASTIINSDKFMTEIRDVVIRTGAVFYGFCFNQCPKMLIESSVLYAKKNSPVTRAWEQEYTNALEIGREKYIYHAFRTGIDLPYQLFKPYPFVNPYFTVYATQRVAISRVIPRNTKVLTRDANTVIYQLMSDCNWHHNCIVEQLRLELTHPAYQVTKVWSWWRLQAWPGSEAKTTTTSREPKFLFSEATLSRNLRILSKLWLFYQIFILIYVYYSLSIYLKLNTVTIEKTITSPSHNSKEL